MQSVQKWKERLYKKPGTLHLLRGMKESFATWGIFQIFTNEKGLLK